LPSRYHPGYHGPRRALQPWHLWGTGSLLERGKSPAAETPIPVPW